MPEPREDQFLGAMLGLAIGDALAMPTAGLSPDEVRDRFGAIRGYHPRTEPGLAEVAAGEVTEETETVLAIVEGMTTGNGRIDPDVVGPRLVYLAKGESRRWFPASTLAALDAAAESLEFRRPLDEDAPAPADLLVRGIPVGLVHAVGKPDRAALFADAETVVRLTHGSTVAISAVAGAAWLVRLAAREEVPPSDWAMETASFLGGGVVADRLLAPSDRDRHDLGLERTGNRANAGDAVDALAEAVRLAVGGERFSDVVFAAAAGGGPADSLGALAGALAGARFGSRGIPQELIDGLGCRIYVSLAAPWFLKAAQRRAGILIDLRPRLGGPRPPLPPSY